MTKKEDQELLSTLIDFMGSIENANDTSEFQEVKKQMLESGMTTEDLFTLLGNNFAETLANRRIIDVPFQKLSDTAIMPQYAHTSDACCDIYADEDIILAAGETKAISTGIAIAVPDGYVVHIYPRSGLSLKSNLRLANSVGVIDAGYRDEIKVPIWNSGKEDFKIEKGMRIAQMCIEESPAIEFTEIDDVKTIQGDRHGGFGSTGFMKDLSLIKGE